MLCAAWDKIKAACLHSLTVAWSYGLLIGGEVLANIDTAAALVTDKQVSEQIALTIGANPTVIGHWTALVGLITAIARARGIVAKQKAAS